MVIVMRTKNNLTQEKDTMGNSYFLVILGILIAKGLGFYRDMVFAGVFGTSVESDIYFQVFGLVNLAFTGIGVALSTLIIKNINKTENAGHEKAYASRFLKKSAFYLTLSAVVLIILAPFIVKIILPDLSPADHELAVKMMYIMSPTLIFVVIAYIISGILQNEKIYFITSIMSLPFNTVILISLFTNNVSILTVGAVTTIGWFLHGAILLPSFYKKGYSFFKSKDNYPIKKDKSAEVLWIFISNMMFQLCFYTDRIFVSANEGMASTFNYASNLFITISSVFVVAMSTVVFPSISKNYEEGNIDYVNDLLGYMISIISTISLPFVLVVAFFGKDIIRLIYERGSFGPDATVSVSIFFLIYTIGILGYVSQELLNKILYLAGKYKYTVIGTVAVVSLNMITNVLIKRFVPATVYGSSFITTQSFFIAVSTSLFLCAYAVFVGIMIKKVVGKYFTKELKLNLLKIFFSGALAAAVYLIFNALLPNFTHGYITFIFVLGTCGAVYLATLFSTGVLKKLLKRK